MLVLSFFHHESITSIPFASCRWSMMWITCSTRWSYRWRIQRQVSRCRCPPSMRCAWLGVTFWVFSFISTMPEVNL
jgi:hypothetical protein